LEIRDVNGTVVANTTTDSNGSFSFNDLPPGKYTVVEHNPKGYTDVTPSVIPVDTSKGDVNVTIVDEPGRTISGKVLEDLDNDNTGDKPLVGVMVELRSANGTVIAKTTSDSNGDFFFNGFPPGKYTVVEYNPKGYTDVSPSVIPLDTSKGDANVTIVDEPVRSISGNVMEDKNNDDTGDKPLVGVLVELRSANGTVIAKTTSDSNGSFSFKDLPPGKYTVVEHNPKGYTDVTPSVIPVDTSKADANVTIVDETGRKISEQR